MLIAIFSNYLLLMVILGYSFLLKKITLNNNNIKIENIDTLYGLSLIIFISLFFNFFFPLIYLKPMVVIFGLLLFVFVKNYIKNKIDYLTEEEKKKSK